MPPAVGIFCFIPSLRQMVGGLLHDPVGGAVSKIPDCLRQSVFFVLFLHSGKPGSE
jgi:hypothetical protein